MANTVPNINKVNTGMCPHGLPPGACPICSGAAGSLRQSDRNRKIGEMTYHECAMIGNMLKARALAKKNHEANIKHRLEAAQQFEQTLINAAQKLAAFAGKLAKIPILVPVALFIRLVPINLLNLIQIVPKLISILKNPKFDIADKLAAIYGEAKAFLNKKLSEIFSKLQSGFLNLFKIFKRGNADDDDTKIDDDKKIFNLKTMINKLRRKIKRKFKDGDDGKNK